MEDKKKDTGTVFEEGNLGGIREKFEERKKENTGQKSEWLTVWAEKISWLRIEKDLCSE